MGNYDLTSKVEEALKSVVDGLSLSGVTVNTGLDDDDLAGPYVICGCDGSGDELVKDLGVYRLSAMIKVASNIDDDDLATHRARVQAVLDAFADDAIAATLSAAVSDFHVYDVERSQLPADTENRKHMNTMEMGIVCCATTIS